MRRLIATLIALSLPAAAPAASWVFVANCGKGDQVRTYSYDPGSVRTIGGDVLVQVRGDYSRAAGSRAREARILWSYNCSNRTFVERSRTEYGTGRAVVGRYRQSTTSMRISPGSIADSVFALVCN